MSGRARRRLSATRMRPTKRANDPLLNGYGMMRQGNPNCSQICATGPDLLKPQTSTVACSRSAKCLARMSACRSAPPSSRLNNTKTMRRPLRVEFEGVSGGSSFCGKCGTHLLQEAVRSRLEKPVRFDDLAIVNQDAQLAEAASDRFDFNSVFLFQLRRHPGGNCFLRKSDRTTTNHYLFHHNVLTPVAPTARLARKHFRTSSSRLVPAADQR